MREAAVMKKKMGFLRAYAERGREVMKRCAENCMLLVNGYGLYGASTQGVHKPT